MKRAVGLRQLGCLAVMGSLGCDAANDGACSAHIQMGIEVEVRDSLDDSPRASIARGVAVEGAYSDSLMPFRSDGLGTLISLAGAPERAGTYSVFLEAPGYQPWSKAGVKVNDSECHVQLVTLVARLQPGP
ncbi:MAG: carboxypeptidase-like regulatory domain-containing protein [Gemmatimonadota bacterium]|nr:carboxypeptidase-like regulatory domain-containing protein [Gemmatimonadota bacterium]